MTWVMITHFFKGPFYLIIDDIKDGGIMLVEAQLVIHFGGDQGDDQGKCVDQDGDSSGFEGQELLHLPPIKFGYVIPIQDRNCTNDSQKVEDHVERLGQG